MRDVDVIALLAWIGGMGVSAAFYLYTHNPISGVGLVLASGGLVFSSVATISTAIQRASKRTSNGE